MKRHIPTTTPFVPDIATGMSIAFIQLDFRRSQLSAYGPGAMSRLRIRAGSLKADS